MSDLIIKLDARKMGVRSVGVNRNQDLTELASKPDDPFFVVECRTLDGASYPKTNTLGEIESEPGHKKRFEAMLGARKPK